MSGQVGDLSPSQQTALKEFRKNVKTILPAERASSDYFLLRWLRARDFDVSKAVEMLRKAQTYRKEMKLDTILDNYEIPEVIKTYQATNLVGFTKTGSPLMIIRTGIIDRKGIFLSIRREEMRKYCLHMAEKISRLMEETSKETGNNISGMIMIQDFQGFGLKNFYRPAMQFFAQMTKIYDENFPELLDALYIVNAPRIFYMLYSAIRPFLSEKTREKVHIYAGNYESKLVEAVGSENLPKFLGGEFVDENGSPFCEAIIGKGGEVPKSYYLSESDEKLSEKFLTAYVGARDSLTMNFDIDTPGSIISWEFKTENHNIAFGIYKNKSCDSDETDKIEAVAVSRRDSHQYTEMGSYCCDTAGQYTAIFDNTFSWINGKTLHYFIEVIPPGLEAIES